MSHRLIQRGPKDWFCTVCHQDWQSKSKAHCPGMHVIKHDEWGTLMTKTMLGKAGYKNGWQDLPEPVCCYRRSFDGSDPEYVMLYDRSLCVRKKEIKKGRRKTGYLSQLVVTPLLKTLIERYEESIILHNTTPFTEDRFLIHYWYQCASDLANAAVCTQLMTDQELERDGFFTIEITPLQFSKGLVFADGGTPSRNIADRVLAGYRLYRDGPTVIESVSADAAAPAPVVIDEAEIERQRLIKEAEDRNRQAREARVREELLEMHVRGAYQPGLTPAVQRSMFDETGV